MKSLDTNIIVRFLVNDDKIQGAKVKKLFEKAETEGENLFITLVVLLETLWVLRSVYQYKKNEIILAISSLYLMAVIEFEKSDLVQEFINLSGDSELELDDLIISLAGKSYNCESTVTFDEQASKSGLFELL